MTTLRAVVLLIAVALALSEFWIAPLVASISALALIGSLWWVSREVESQRDKRTFAGRSLQISMLLLGGLWIGVFTVFRLADSGVDSASSTSVPISLNGEAVSAQQVVFHGLLSGASLSIIAGLVLRMRVRSRRGMRR